MNKNSHKKYRESTILYLLVFDTNKNEKTREKFYMD